MKEKYKEEKTIKELFCDVLEKIIISRNKKLQKYWWKIKIGGK